MMHLILFDTELNALSGVSYSFGFLGVWTCSNTNSLASSATVADNTLTWTATINKSGSGGATLTGSNFQFDSPGYYRITYNVVLSGTSAVTEGYLQAGLKKTGVASFVAMYNKQVPMETREGRTFSHYSFLVKADTAGAEVDTGVNYQIGAIQQNSSTANATLGSTDTWFSVEYVRGL